MNDARDGHCKLDVTADLMTALAQVYLEQRGLHWPALLNAPLDVQEHATALAADLINRIERKEMTSTICNEIQSGACGEIAGCYLRYTSAAAPPLAEQIVEVLAAAKTKNHFIPWQLVFADVGDSRDAERLMTTMIQAQTDLKEIYIPASICRTRDEALGFAKRLWTVKKGLGVVFSGDARPW